MWFAKDRGMQLQFIRFDRFELFKTTWKTYAAEMAKKCVDHDNDGEPDLKTMSTLEVAQEHDTYKETKTDPVTPLATPLLTSFGQGRSLGAQSRMHTGRASRMFRLLQGETS